MTDTIDLETQTTTTNAEKLTDNQRQEIVNLDKSISGYLEVPIGPDQKANGVDIRQEVQVLELQKAAIIAGKSGRHFVPVGIFSPDQIRDRFKSDAQIFEVPAYQINPQTSKVEKLSPNDGVMVFEEGPSSNPVEKTT